MRGLLQKNLYMIWNYGRMLLVMSVIFLLVGTFAAEETFFFVIYPVLFAGVLPVTLLSYDERSGWVPYCDALPLRRRTVVSAHYISAALCFLVLYAVTLLLHAAVNLPKGQGREVLEMAALLPVFGLIAPAVMLPLTLRFGVEKARIAYWIIIGVVVAFGLGLFNSGVDLSGEIGGGGLAAMPAAAVLLFAASWLLSIRLYEKREF